MPANNNSDIDMTDAASLSRGQGHDHDTRSRRSHREESFSSDESAEDGSPRQSDSIVRSGRRENDGTPTPNQAPSGRLASASRRLFPDDEQQEQQGLDTGFSTPTVHNARPGAARRAGKGSRVGRQRSGTAAQASTSSTTSATATRASTETERLQNEITELRRQLAAAEGRDASANAVALTLKSVNLTHQETLVRVQQLEVELKEEKELVQDFVSASNAADAEIAELRARCADLKNVEGKLERVQAELERARAQAKVSRSDNENKAEENRLLRGRVDQLTTSAAAMDQLYNDRADMVASRDRLLDNRSKQLADKDDTITGLNADVAKLTEQLKRVTRAHDVACRRQHDAEEQTIVSVPDVSVDRLESPSTDPQEPALAHRPASTVTTQSDARTSPCVLLNAIENCPKDGICTVRGTVVLPLAESSRYRGRGSNLPSGQVTTALDTRDIAPTTWTVFETLLPGLDAPVASRGYPDSRPAKTALRIVLLLDTASPAMDDLVDRLEACPGVLAIANRPTLQAAHGHGLCIDLHFASAKRCAAVRRELREGCFVVQLDALVRNYAPRRTVFIVGNFVPDDTTDGAVPPRPFLHAARSSCVSIRGPVHRFEYDSLDQAHADVKTYIRHRKRDLQAVRLRIQVHKNDALAVARAIQPEIFPPIAPVPADEPTGRVTRARRARALVCPSSSR